PAVLRLREQCRRPDPRAHVDVVTAGVHHGHRRSRAVLRGRLARVGESGPFFDRESVEIGADHHGWSLAVGEQTDDPGPPDSGRDLETERAEAVRQLRRRLFLVKGELRILVKVEIQLLQIRIEGVERSEHRRGRGIGRSRGRGSERGGGDREEEDGTSHVFCSFANKTKAAWRLSRMSYATLREKWQKRPRRSARAREQSRACARRSAPGGSAPSPSSPSRLGFPWASSGSRCRPG